jgi:hypothetical protein
MPSGVRRFVFAALAVSGLSLVLSSSAQAQSALPTEIESVPATTLKLDYDAAVRSTATSTALNARAASFLRQGGAANEDSGIGVGVLGMLTWPSIDVIDEDANINSRTGWGVGAWVGGNRNGRVGFVGEFIYAVRRVTDADDDDDVDFKTFEIPAVFHVNFGSRSRDSIGGYVVVGPVFSFYLGQTVYGEDIDDDSKFKGADIGIIAGAGIEIFRIGIEGRGNWGLREISNEGDVNKIKTTTFELLGKFAFN